MTARLYLIVADTPEKLTGPSFASQGGKSFRGAMHVENLAAAQRMGEDELGAILDELATILAHPILEEDGPVYVAEPPRAPVLPFPVEEEDLDAWRAAMDRDG